MENQYDTNSVKIFGKIREEDALHGKPVDGIYFKKLDDIGITYNVDFISFTPGTKFSIHEETGYPRWLVVLFEQDGDTDVYDVFYHQAVIGDIMYFVNNQIKAGSQGMVMKTSKPGFQAIYGMMKSSPAVGIVQQIIENMSEWDKECAI